MSADLIHTLGCIATWCQGRDEGWWPINQRDIGRHIGVSRETVNRRIHQLIHIGYLEMRQIYRRDGGQAANQYRVAVYFVPPVNRRRTAWHEATAGMLGPAPGDYDGDSGDDVDNPPPPVTLASHPPVTPEHHTPVTPEHHTPVTPEHHTPVTPEHHTTIDTDLSTDLSTDHETEARGPRALSPTRKKASRTRKPGMLRDIPDAWRGGDEAASDEWARSPQGRGYMARLGYMPLQLFRSGTVYRKADKQAAYRQWCDEQGIQCWLEAPLTAVPPG